MWSKVCKKSQYFSHKRKQDTILLANEIIIMMMVMMMMITVVNMAERSPHLIRKYEGRPINKLQNGIILLIFKI